MKNKNVNQNFSKTEQEILNHFLKHGQNISKLNSFYLNDYNPQISRLKNKERNCFNLLINVLFGYTENVKKIFEDLDYLIKNKSLYSSMFLYRGLIEIIIFDIFITFKIFNHLINKDIEQISKIVCRAAISVDYGSEMKNFLTKDKFYNELIKNFSGKRIHINDCLNFYEKQNWESILTKNYSSYEFFNELELKNNNSFQNKSQMKLIKLFYLKQYQNHNYYKEVEFTGLKYIYFKLCEIIHPTAIFLHNHKDVITNKDYKNLICGFNTTDLGIVGTSTYQFKEIIIKWLSIHKKEFLDNF